jgi:hypothetical protein
MAIVEWETLTELADAICLCLLLTCIRRLSATRDAAVIRVL